jgi:hypothetical protein
MTSGLSQLADRMPYDLAVQQAAAAKLAPGDPRTGWAKARLSRAGG